MKEIIIYTDGACSGNPGPGGWGAVLYYKGTKKEIYGGEKNTTNNRMGLTATIKALENLTEPCKVTLYTDSNYVKDGITKWIIGWKKSNWRTANKQPVKNKELWQDLENAAAKHQIDWQWVKGHSGNEGNELADLLAIKGRDETT